ncbi:hypothetical protein GW931_02740 [archaeon]|nr:hypothetical protein [archaeon]
MIIEIFGILVSIFGILMSIGYFPQAYKIYKNKDAKGISIISYLIFFVGCLVWLIYGALLQDFHIIISFVVGVIGSFLVLVLALKYK